MLVLWKLDRLGPDFEHLVGTAVDPRVRGLGLKVLAAADRLARKEWSISETDTATVSAFLSKTSK